MNLQFPRALRWWFLCGAASGLCLMVCGQTPPAPPAGTITVVVATNIPPLPIFLARTEIFRKVLAMTPAEQEAWLTNRPAASRPQLQAKIRQYEAMSPDAREAVLRATELHEYLEFFIKAPPALRSSELAQVPLKYRTTISERLGEFDILPPQLQAEVLAGKTTAAYFLNPPPLAVRKLHPSVPPPPLPPPPEPFRYLSRLPPEQRQTIYASFEHFFDLDSGGREEILSALPAKQREPVEKTLHELEKLPREQRDRGLQSISALAGMTDEEQQAFFKNAEVWEKLPVTERQTWRKVVAHLPPLPPAPGEIPMRARPPMTSSAGGVSVDTNLTN